MKGFHAGIDQSPGSGKFSGPELRPYRNVVLHLIKIDRQRIIPTGYNTFGVAGRLVIGRMIPSYTINIALGWCQRGKMSGLVHTHSCLTGATKIGTEDTLTVNVLNQTPKKCRLRVAMSTSTIPKKFVFTSSPKAS